MATHSSILAWRITWREEPGRLVQGVTKSRTRLSDNTHTRILAWEVPRTEEPGGLQSVGPQRAGHD